MKLKLLLSVFLVSFLASAEQPKSHPDKCGIVKYMDYLRSNDPSRAAQDVIDENLLQQNLSNQSVSRISNLVYTIPVVVHVVYRTNAQNISDAQIQAQIDVLNEDFGRTNPDSVNTPPGFTSVAGSTNFQFCLAQQDPAGQLTNGIDRRLTTLQSFQANDDVKSYATGGLDAWDVNKYLNIWVCNLSGGILGYGELPSSVHTTTYGVVVAYDAFGKGGSAASPYNLGRTCTHEISHCFRLYHIWGDDNGTCSGSDYVNDTPNKGDATFGCLTYPALDNCTAVSPGIMFMNYMDYSDDNCLNLFTKNQASRMFTAINSYYPTLLTSDRCNPPVTNIDKTPADYSFNIYPNPSSGVFIVDMTKTKDIGQTANFKISDSLGKIIIDKQVLQPSGSVHELDLSGLSSGVYSLTVYNESYSRTERIMLRK